MGSKVSRAGGICAICQEPDNAEMARPSNCATHYFHRRCLIQWATVKSSCPLDNQPFAEVVDIHGRRTLVQRFRSYSEDARSTAAQLMRLANPASNGYRCKLCNKTDETLELALVTECKHVFHRKCVVRFARKFHRCPGEGCYNRTPLIGTELEDRIEIPAKEDVHCPICEKGETGEEWAHPDCCNHYFHVSCLKNKASTARVCPLESCGQPLKFLHCDYGEKVAMRPDDSPIKCTICDIVDVEKEKALLVPCCHLFHTSCLFINPRLSLYCRQPGCCQKIESIMTESGMIILPTPDESATTYAKTMAGSNFICFICHENETETERAKPASCGCEFHRTCLTKYALDSVGFPRCPICKHQFKHIQCLFGDDIVLKEVLQEERRQSIYRSVPDLSRAARASRTGELAGLEVTSSPITRATSYGNLI